MTARYLRAGATVILMALFAACGSSGGTSSTPNPTAAGSTSTTTAAGGGMIVVPGHPATSRADLATALQALCTVAAQARTDATTASDTFTNDAHEALHIVAGAVADTNRAVAGRMLIAKERVEADFEHTTAPNVIVRDVARLILAVQRAAPIVGVTAPRCAS